jgi:hypothetical protein
MRIAELLTAVAVVMLAAVLFLPQTEADAAGVGEYGSEIILAVIIIGVVAVCFAAEWKPTRLVLCLPLYFTVWTSFVYFAMNLSPKGIMQCATETLLR